MILSINFHYFKPVPQNFPESPRTSKNLPESPRISQNISSIFIILIIFSGIPLVSSANNGSPASSQGPSSIHSVTSNPPNSGKPPSLTSNGSSSGGTRSAGLNGVMSTKNSGPENSSNHEYYNDYDRFKNLQPLKLQPPPAKHETTV